MMGQEPRQTTSCIGHLNKPSIQALIHGLNRHYYSIPVSFRKNELEEKVRGAAGGGGCARWCFQQVASTVANLRPTHPFHPPPHPTPPSRCS